jgi:hypothetical protein
MDEIALRTSNVVRFELPAYADVDGFCSRIRPRWRGSQRKQDEVWVVSAQLHRAANDLALLLREVEGYVADTALLAIRYQLDGRFYVMEAAAALDRAASF